MEVGVRKQGQRNYLYFYYWECQLLGGSAMPRKTGCEDGVVVVYGVDDDDGDEGLFLAIWEKKVCGHQPPTNSIF